MQTFCYRYLVPKNLINTVLYRTYVFAAKIKQKDKTEVNRGYLRLCISNSIYKKSNTTYIHKSPLCVTNILVPVLKINCYILHHF